MLQKYLLQEIHKFLIIGKSIINKTAQTITDAKAGLGMK